MVVALNIVFAAAVLVGVIVPLARAIRTSAADAPAPARRTQRVATPRRVGGVVRARPTA